MTSKIECSAGAAAAAACICDEFRFEANIPTRRYR